MILLNDHMIREEEKRKILKRLRSGVGGRDMGTFLTRTPHCARFVAVVVESKKANIVS